MRGGIRDIYTVDLESQEVANLTTDEFFDYGPAYSPDGKFIVYTARVSGNQKLFRLDLATKQKKQLSFGTNDETPGQFVDDHTVVFSSTAVDPSVAIDPETAKNGNIYNLWTLDLNNGELKQFTDALGGVFSPIVLKDSAANRVAFIGYYKGEFSIHTLERKEPIHTAASADFGAPGPIIDFQAPLQHTLVAANARRKKSFEKMFLEGRPPVNVGVTNNGDVFGGTEISFGDVLGDKQVNLFASSIAQYRTLSLSYVNLGRRFQYALQGYSQTQFFYGQLEGVFYDPSLAPLISRDAAVATRTVRGGSAFGIYPLDRFRRLEVSGGVINLQEQYNDPFLQQSAEQFQQQNFGQQVFRNGTLVPLTTAFVQETTVFREFGPLAGSTMRFAYDVAPKIAGTLSRQTFDGDARYYQRLASTGVLALRLRGFKSIGAYPDFLYFGGNSEMRGYDYLQFVGQNVAFANAELRFPIIEAALTPIGVIGGIRGVFFADLGGGWFNNQDFKFATSKAETIQPDRRFPARRDRRHPPRSDHAIAAARLWAAQDDHRFPVERRPRVLRPRSRDVRARVPDPFRLVMAHAVQSQLGRSGLLGRRSRPRGRAAASGSGSRASPSGLDTTSERKRGDWLQASGSGLQHLLKPEAEAV